MLTVDHWPELERPVLFLALTGWVDAGAAGAGTLEALRTQLPAADPFAEVDLTDLLDLQQVRPTARLQSGGVRVIDWPRVELVAGRLGRDVVLVHGPESSLRWPSLAAALVDAARRLDVSEAATLGGMPALVSHRRPVPVLTTATSRSLAQEVGPLREDYAGPTGLQTVVQAALGDAGIPCVGYWAQVPQYVAGSPSPPAVRALLARLHERFGVDADLSRLDRQCETYVAKVDAGLAMRPDVEELVRRIEEQQPDEVPNADDLADEIERFLRDQD